MHRCPQFLDMMRNHFLECFKTGKLTPFPTVDKKARKRAEGYFEVKVEVCSVPVWCRIPTEIWCNAAHVKDGIINVLIYSCFLLKTSHGVALHAFSAHKLYIAIYRCTDFVKH